MRRRRHLLLVNCLQSLNFTLILYLYIFLIIFFLLSVSACDSLAQTTVTWLHNYDPPHWTTARIASELTSIMTPHRLSTSPQAACLGPHTRPRIAHHSTPSSVRFESKKQTPAANWNFSTNFERQVTWLNSGSRCEGRVAPPPDSPAAAWTRQTGRHIGAGRSFVLLCFFNEATSW